MSRLAPLLGVVALLAAAPPGPRAGAEEDRPSPVRSVPTTPAAPDIDLRQIRNIFRYADGPPAERLPGLARRRPPETGPADVAAEDSRVRLVGLVEKGGSHAAALSIDGQVVVLEEGESSGGVTVIAVGDEAVSLRGPEGEEETLLLP